MLIIDDLVAKDLYALRKSNGWKEISLEQLEKGLNHTMCKVTIKENNTLIACGRLVGDYSCKGVLSDILVHPNYQGKGYGKLVLNELFRQTKEMMGENDLFQIEATPTNGNREFYVKCGMKYKPENQDGTYVWFNK